MGVSLIQSYPLSLFPLDARQLRKHGTQQKKIEVAGKHVGSFHINFNQE